MTNQDTESLGFFGLIKKVWPCFASYLPFAFTLSVFYINIKVVSIIIWPLDSFEVHAGEIGVLFGISTYILAISGIIFGNLADRHSRIKLFSLSTFFFGLSFVLNGFVPEGLNYTTFSLFLIFIIIRGFFSGAFWPLINSYLSDKSKEDEKSKFFGVLNSTFQLVQLIGMITAAFFFESGLWRSYFWIFGLIISIIGILILKAEEPKRASTTEELHEILARSDILYVYKLNMNTIKDTILKPTNLVAFAEGIFTTILLSVPDFLLVAYIQTPPINFSPIVSSLFMVIFGLPGSVIGSLVFANISDKLAKKSIKNRVYLIVISLVGIFSIFMIVFLLPLPALTSLEGQDFFLILSYPIFWVLGLVAFLARSILGLYSINQPPVLQKINLPESQGFISSANQFLEGIGYGTGPILAGILLFLFDGNYQITVTLTMSLGILGAFLWVIATKWIEEDISRISKILMDRREELNGE
ncbi:MAG: MFS transporter [Candidatus Lokiarchaeota archaeon]|nr:MFS transporter [Candidatus Lokiarchaeota archaeon]MBD3198935.1 MFS transporter [Candidatus Lokiarchaeota archaeon]